MIDVLKVPTREKQEAVAKAIADKLCSCSIRPASHPEAIQKALSLSLEHNTPLRLRAVLCPNWIVTKNGRSINPIPVETSENRLVLPEENLKLVGLLTEEVPNLVAYLIRQGLKVELLVVLADILSEGWVYDPRKAKEMLAQNQRATKLLLFSSILGKEIFNDKNKARVSVQSQLQLATHTPGYKNLLNAYQKEVLTHGTPMYEWFLEVIRKLQEMGEYQDKRTDLSGLKKIWERALFLSAIYALDGQVIENDFTLAGFPQQENHYGYLALGTVATPHGDIIAQGWNLGRDNPIGVITPFNNAMGHSWSEPRASSISF